MVEVHDSNETERNWQAHGYDLKAVRHPSMGHWCGYVALPNGHRLFGKGYDDIDVSVHGGLTYAEDRAPRMEVDGKWWVGFDCAHSGDLVPGLGHSFSGDVYRDISYVASECESLAAQLAEH